MTEHTKVFRFLYWFGSITTERYIRARDEAEARAKFSELTNGKKVISVEVVKE